VLMPWVAVVRNPVVLGAIFAGMTYAGGVVNVAGVTYQIQVTPDALQGRVSSVLVLIGSGASSVGALAGGLVLDAVGDPHGARRRWCHGGAGRAVGAESGRAHGRPEPGRTARAAAGAALTGGCQLYHRTGDCFIDVE